MSAGELRSADAILSLARRMVNLGDDGSIDMDALDETLSDVEANLRLTKVRCISQWNECRALSPVVLLAMNHYSSHFYCLFSPGKAGMHCVPC